MTSPSFSTETNSENAPSNSCALIFHKEADHTPSPSSSQAQKIPSSSAKNDGIPIVDLIPKRVCSRLRKTSSSAIPISKDVLTNEQTPPLAPSR
ncbi:hypothetical protein HAX54_034293, partial [Datura stramonium]|nr:hypothetical protein [Datura stramonium]